MSFFRLTDILQRLKQDYPALNQRLSEAEILAKWAQVVGDPIRKHTRAIAVQNKTLHIEVDHPAWKTELAFRKTELLEKLKSGSSPVDLEDLVFFNPGGTSGKGALKLRRSKPMRPIGKAK